MKVVILGGGIGGLSAAYYLQKLTQHKIVVVEASNRFGGWIRSHKLQNGLILEEGPRTLRPRGESGFNTLALMDELKLSDQIRPIRSTHLAARNRYIYVNGQLHALPTSWKALFRRTPPFSKPLVSALFRDLRTKPKYVEDESIHSFVERRFGKEIADYAINPLICGICGGNARHISVNFLLSHLFEREQKYGSVTKSYLRPWNWTRKKSVIFSETVRRAVKEKWSSYSLYDGLESLPQRLAERVQQDGIVIHKNYVPKQINFRKKLIYSDDGEMPFDLLISAIPAPNLAKLLYKDYYYHLAKPLQAISYTSIVTVNLVYHKPVLKIQGFGFLTPPSENLPILGTIFDSCYAPFKDWTVLTVMMGGHSFDKYFSENCSEDTLVRIAIENVQKILNIDSRPDMHRVAILRNCIPQHVIGHKHRVVDILAYIKQEELPLFLIGNAFKGTGINDVILSAKETANQVLNYGKESEEFEQPRYKIDYL